MSYRHAGYVVALEEDLVDEYSEKVINAIMQIKGVISVKPVVADPAMHIAEDRVRLDVLRGVTDMLYPPRKK